MYNVPPVSKRTMSFSPDVSPPRCSSVDPKPKRQRTVVVRNLTTSLTDSRGNSNNLFPRPLTMADFEETREEGAEHSSINQPLFSLTNF